MNEKWCKLCGKVRKILDENGNFQLIFMYSGAFVINSLKIYLVFARYNKILTDFASYDSSRTSTMTITC